MILSESQIIQKIKKRPNEDRIQVMKSYVSRLKVMSEPLFYYDIQKESGFYEILSAIKKSVTPEKYQRVLNFFSFPPPIVTGKHRIS